MKKSAIIAASIAAVMAGTAVADATVYGRARMELAIATADDNVGLQNSSSRFGFKGSEDLGNGLSTIYHFELGYNAENAGQGGISNRIGVVGLKGDFGTFAMGNMWTPSYNLVDGSVDVFNGANMGFGTLAGRAGDALAYVNKFGSVDFQAAIVANDSGTEDDMMDGYNIAVKIPAGPVTIAVGLASDTDETGTTIVVGYKGDGFTVAGGIQDDEDLKGPAGDSTVSVTGTFNVGSGKLLARFESHDVADVTGTVIGYHHNLSKRTQAYIENSSADLADETVIGLKHNF